MTIAEALARPLISGIFIYGGLDAFRNPSGKTDTADPVLEPAGEMTGLQGEQLVRLNGGVQVVAGAALAFGILPRPAAAVLAASLIPTTLGGHRFWEQEDAKARTQQTTHLLKNVSMLGGLILAATSTGGRPSLPWRARRSARRLVESAGETIEHLRPTG